jgi:alpha-N-arabinofuranosidase
MRNKFLKIRMAGALILVSLFVHAQKESDIVVNADKIQTEIQPTMWGVFFEDINFGADGGLYAELVKKPPIPRCSIY